MGNGGSGAPGTSEENRKTRINKGNCDFLFVSTLKLHGHFTDK